MERVTDEWLAKSIAFMQAMQGWFTDSQNNELQAMLELRDRRAQRCETCLLHHPDSWICDVLHRPLDYARGQGFGCNKWRLKEDGQ